MGEVAGNETFEQICARSGIAEEFRGPDHAFIDEAPDGIRYAIPKEITIGRPDGSTPVYTLRENGAAVALDAHVEKEVEIASRTVVHPRASIIGTSVIGAMCEIEEWAAINTAVLDDAVKLDKGAVLRERVTVGHSSILGKRICVNADAKLGPRTILGNDVFIDEGTRLHHDVMVGARSHIYARCVIDPGVVIQEFSTIDQDAEIGAYSVVSKVF